MGNFNEKLEDLIYKFDSSIGLKWIFHGGSNYENYDVFEIVNKD